MPFFLKPCLKLRKKCKKSSKENVMHPVTDITRHVTNSEIWQRDNASSMPSSTTTLNEKLDKVERIETIQHQSISKNDNLSINENKSIDAYDIKSDNESTGVSLSNKHVGSTEEYCVGVAEIESVKNTPSYENLSPVDEISSPIVYESVGNNNKVMDKFETFNTNVVPQSDKIFEWNDIKEFKRESCEIINNVTVCSDVFAIIERIDEIERADILKDYSKGEESIGENEGNKISDSVGETGVISYKTNSVCGTRFEKDNYLEKSSGSLHVENEINLSYDLPNKVRSEIERDSKIPINVHRTESRAFSVGIDPEIDRNTLLNNSDTESQINSIDRYEKDDHNVNSVSGDSQWSDVSVLSSESEFVLSVSQTVSEWEVVTENNTFETSETNTEMPEGCKIVENSNFPSGDTDLKSNYCKSGSIDIPIDDSSDFKKKSLSTENEVTFNKKFDSCSHSSISQEICNSRKNSGDVQNQLQLNNQKCSISTLREFGDVNTSDISNNSQLPEVFEMSTKSVFLSQFLTTKENEVLTATNTFETSETNIEKTEERKTIENSKIPLDGTNLESNYFSSIDIPMMDSFDLKNYFPTSKIDITSNKKCNVCGHRSLLPEITNRIENSGGVQTQLENEKCAISTLSEFGDVCSLDSSDDSQSTWTKVSEMSSESDFLLPEPLNVSRSEVFTSNRTFETTQTDIKKSEDGNKIVENSKFPLGDINLENCNFVNVPMKESSDFKKAPPTSEIDITFNKNYGLCGHRTISSKILNSRKNSGDVQNQSSLDHQQYANSTLNGIAVVSTADISEIDVNSDSTHEDNEYKSKVSKRNDGVDNIPSLNSKHNHRADKIDLVNHFLPKHNQENKLFLNYAKATEDEVSVKYHDIVFDENKILGPNQLMVECSKTGGGENDTLLHPNEGELKNSSNEFNRFDCLFQGDIENGSQHDIKHEKFLNDDISCHSTLKSQSTSSNDETDSTCFESNDAVNFNSNGNISNATNIHLYGHHQTLEPRDIDGFCELMTNSDCEKLNYLVDEYEDDIRETKMYTSSDGYSSDDVKHKSLSEDSDNEGSDSRNFFQTSHETFVEKERSLLEETLQPEKNNSNLIDFHQDIIVKNRDVYNHNDADTVTKNTSQSRCDEFYKYSSNELDWENTSNSSDMSDKERNLKSGVSNGTKMRHLLEKDHPKIGAGRVGRTKAFKKCRIGSHSGSSESSDSGHNLKVSENDSFVLPVFDDKNIVDNRNDFVGETSMVDDDNASCTKAESIVLPDRNIITTKPKSRSALRIRISKNNPPQRKGVTILDKDKSYSIPSGNMFVWNNGSYSEILPIQKNTSGSIIINTDYVQKQKRDLLKIPSIEGTHNLENILKSNDSNEIEMIRRQSIERFHIKKNRALSVMGPHLKNIPTKKVRRNACKVENFTLDKGEPTTPDLNKGENDLNNIQSFQGTDNEEVIENLAIIPHIDHQTYFSESDIESYVSATSEKMSPGRKRILMAGRAIRSPKHPYRDLKKSSPNTMLYRRRPIIIKPAKQKLVAYLAKDEQNNVHLKKGYRVCNVSSQKIISSEKDKRTTYFTRHPPQKTPTNRATSPIELKVKFDDAFKKYASRGRTNGNLISFKRSTEWLIDAGVIGKTLSFEEANAVFKKTAGVKVTLNKCDYRNFLWKLTRVKKLSYNDIYEKLSLVVSECAESSNA